MATERASYQLDLEGTVDPTLGPGVAAPIGNLYRLLTTGALFAKVGVADTAWVSMLGAFLGRQILAGAGVYTPTPGTRTVRLQMVGGGGGSGGTGGGGGAVLSVSGGGGSGAYIEKTIDPGSAILGGAYAVGAAGAAGALGVSTGGTGGDTTITIQAVLYTAKSGTGGASVVSGGITATSHGGAPQTGSTAADFEAGEPGTSGIQMTSTTATGGVGGSNPLGQGGNGTASGNSVGAAGRGFGAGGGGSVSSNLDQTGAAGTAGTIIIDEYS